MGIRPIALIIAGLAAAGTAWAQDSDEMNIEGLEIVTETEAPEHLENLRTIYSGWRFRTDETQSLQLDDFENPAFVFIDQALDAFDEAGANGNACSTCHENGPEEFAGFTAAMPKVMDGKLTTTEDFLNGHRAETQGEEPWKWSSQDMQQMVALIGLQSRGMPVDVAIDGEAAPYWELGKEMYYTRYGQLELSCANCHEDNYGMMIRADHLSQGQTNGFPTYRLKQAKLISRHNRFRGCIRDTRAETFAEGSDEFRALELYVASRANGLSVETPAVRQ
ncbi:sulfur oxidation c-type cytochrome SoxA [Poseidonocella sedimentorum]|uniref:SoxAX cytochrome complex subunit A n=1 Tax=Poseidonocella sedimentorum TaxID=871652 RepID=A0A1I6DV84_9RHOB|nr:sulfur oxidation c-type cytochrome SoxA [Poseidonocella sedimentorum]SFR09373.1 diheme cytochrome SoxA (sulfur oxidation) [Poseidonocella sedimentorum]